MFWRKKREKATAQTETQNVCDQQFPHGVYQDNSSGGLKSTICFVGHDCAGKHQTLLGMLDKQTLELEGSENDRYEISVEFEANHIRLEMVVILNQVYCSRSPLPRLYRSSAGFFLVYSIYNRESFEDLCGYLCELRRYSRRASYIVIGTDYISEACESRVVSFEEAVNFAHSEKLLYYEVCLNNQAEIRELVQNLLRVVFNTGVSNVKSARSNKPLI